MRPGDDTPGQTWTVTRTGTRAPRSEPAAKLAQVSLAPAVLDDPASIPPQYVLGELLGRGGMGAVYRARDTRLDRDVALKFLASDDGDDGERLLREARAQARIDHEHVCKVYEVGTVGGARFIAMQYVPGEPLGRAARAMTLEEKAGVVRKVALALHEAHRSGLVHRDVKPGNILVERGADGACKPYIVDFGIAREAGARGATATGALAGTPAFMAPEQARGEVHSLDRRTDVYGLGATLYAAIAGRAPFEGPAAWVVLRSIVGDDAPPLRKLLPAIPRDIEAIVARCLEKEPQRRYASALALAEDLQRFLDGAPVEARRLSPGYVLYRRARRQRGPILLGIAALLALFAVLALRASDRRAAAEQAHFAREIGEDVKEMELFLRNAHGLPLHDIEVERDIVRARLRAVEDRMRAAGAPGEGPGHYALGRGYLALQEPDRALDELTAARAAGYAPPELDYATGMALVELYDRALVDLRRIDDPEARKAEEAALAAALVAPALRHLRAALGARVEVPEYVEGLIALREGRPEEALARAEAALAAAPWLYEAKKLEGDAHFALGSPFAHDAAFDYDRMMVHFQRAAASYRAAAEIARSDPRVHEAECQLWHQIMNAAPARPETLGPSHERARDACGRAVVASSTRASSRVALAFVEASYAWLIEVGGAAEDTESALGNAIDQASEAAMLAPEAPMAPYLLGLAWGAHANHMNQLGLDSGPSTQRSIAAYEDALALDPLFTWAQNDLASTYLQKALGDELQGIDPTDSLEQVIAYSGRAASLAPALLHAHANAAAAHLLQSEHLVDTGRDPSAPLERGRAEIATCRSLSGDWPWANYFSAYADWIEASHLLATDQDPSAALDRGAALAAEHARSAPSSPDGHEVVGKLAMLRALLLSRRGKDASQALGEARAAFARAAACKPWDTRFPILEAQVDLLDLRLAAGKRAALGAGGRGAFAARAAEVERLLGPLLAQGRVDPRACQGMAALREIQAVRRIEEGGRAEAEIAAGLSLIERALAVNAHMPSALATKSALLLAQARSARDGRERSRAAGLAVEAAAAALRENPRVDVETTLREAKALSGN